MKLFLRDIPEQGSDLTFSQNDGWLVELIAQLDETDPESKEGIRQKIRSLGAPIAPTPRDIDLTLNSQKVEDVYLLRGELKTRVLMICSRCAEGFQHTCTPKFTLAFSQNREISTDGDGDEITFLPHSYIELDTILTEQLRLALPYRPLCKDDCKGLCHECGVNLNQETCACEKIKNNPALSVLKNYKLKTKGDS